MNLTNVGCENSERIVTGFKACNSKTQQQSDSRYEPGTNFQQFHNFIKYVNSKCRVK